MDRPACHFSAASRWVACPVSSDTNTLPSYMIPSAFVGVDAFPLLAGMGLFGLALAGLAPTQWLWHRAGLAAVLQWCLLTGLFAGMIQVPIANTLLRDLPDALRGRGVGLLSAITVNFTILGAVVGGAAAAVFGVAASIIAAGVALAAFAGGAALAKTFRPSLADDTASL